LLLIPTGLLMAQGPGQTEKNIVSTTTPRVSISNLAGKVMVRGWDRLQVHVAYTSVSPKVAVDTEQVPSKVLRTRSISRRTSSTGQCQSRIQLLITLSMSRRMPAWKFTILREK